MKKFFIDLGERAGKTFMQAAIGAILALGVNNVFDISKNDLKTVLGIAAFSTIASLATSIGSSFVGNKNSASMVDHLINDVENTISTSNDETK